MKTVFASISEIFETHYKRYNEHIHIAIEGEETEIESSMVSICEYLVRIFIQKIIQGHNDIPNKTEQNQKNSDQNLTIKASSDLKNLILSIESNFSDFNFENILKILNRKNININYMSEKEIHDLLELTNCLPNFQDIINAKTTVAMLGGNIEILGEKTIQINISIPISCSITKALLVTVADQTFAIPLDYIQTIINKDSVDIKNACNSELILYMKEAIPLIRVAEKLDLIQCNSNSSCILIVSVNNRIYALLVDSLLDETDVVIKPKAEVLNDVHELRGTTILGDGNITLVLDVPALVCEN
ncbi:two-component system chemotaxis sensor kinase CheA [Clostridium punense]|uniref:histidine kinase n=1 Tax=Clostridium punense TaxID=1054297 RepID=A0ABS4K2T0_9CLOT|nr:MULTISPECIES: chemotaxis protein CheW [Clostridium]MBP2022089.1 two-component system chemotaxis sensor kinase CheA [Clostridium punense]